MRGHGPIITMRRNGFRPDLVTISTDLDYLESWRYWYSENASTAEVEIAETDLLSELDMRFVVGLSVQIIGTDGARVQRIGRACQAAGAKFPPPSEEK